MSNLELADKYVDFIKKTIFSVLPDVEIYIYGSRVQGKAREYSDVDIALKGNIVFNDLLKVKALFEDSTFPYKVDVVDLNTLPEKFLNIIEKDLYKTLDMIKPHVEIAAVTRSAKGSVIVNGRTQTFVEAEKVPDVVDTTGAGDSYAAGFLYGIINGRSLGTCAIIGSIAASEVISHYGARPEVSLRGFVRKKLIEYGIRV